MRTRYRAGKEHARYGQYSTSVHYHYLGIGWMKPRVVMKRAIILAKIPNRPNISAH